MNCRLKVDESSQEDEDNPGKKLRLGDAVETDLSVILGTEVFKIGTATPCEDFIELLKKGKKTVKEISAEMEEVIIQLLLDSAGANAALLAKSCDCLLIYRQKAIDGGWPQDFNFFMERFKAVVINNGLQKFWQEKIVGKICLITVQDSSASDVSEAASAEFYRLISNELVDQSAENDDDLVIQFPILTDLSYNKS